MEVILFFFGSEGSRTVWPSVLKAVHLHQPELRGLGSSGCEY